MVWARCFIRACRCEEYGNKARERGVKGGGLVEGNHHTQAGYFVLARRESMKKMRRARTRDGKKFDPPKVGGG